MPFRLPIWLAEDLNWFATPDAKQLLRMPSIATTMSDCQIMNHLPEVQPSATLREKVAKARRIVIKVGTNVVMRDDGRLALSQLYGIAESVARLRQQGRDVLMVSSGAVGLGMERIGLASRPDGTLADSGLRGHRAEPPDGDL